jgi:hypothetical protein
MMRHRQRISEVLIALMLGCAAARADDACNPTEPPDPGFLEFLGSVDRLADVNPEYLGQAEARSKPAATMPPPPPPRPPQAPNAPNGTGGHNNE